MKGHRVIAIAVTMAFSGVQASVAASNNHQPHDCSDESWVGRAHWCPKIAPDNPLAMIVDGISSMFAPEKPASGQAPQRAR
jgi:hypothetical protein